MSTPDPVMAMIIEAVTKSRQGDTASARASLTTLWQSIGPGGDPLHRCTLAHYLADLHDDAAESLVWDVRALDAADTLTDTRAQQHDAALQVRGFYPSLHLNLADDYRRLGASAAAHRHLDTARGCMDALGEDAYGATIRAGIGHVADALAAGSTARLESH